MNIYLLLDQLRNCIRSSFENRLYEIEGKKDNDRKPHSILYRKYWQAASSMHTDGLLQNIIFFRDVLVNILKQDENHVANVI